MGGVVGDNIRDEYGREQIRVRPLDEQVAHQLAKNREVDVSLWPRALEPVLVRPVRVEEDAEEEDVQQTPAPRRLLDSDVAIEPRVFRPVAVSLSDRLDFDHHTRDVPRQGGQHGVSTLAVGYTCFHRQPG